MEWFLCNANDPVSLSQICNTTLPPHIFHLIAFSYSSNRFRSSPFTLNLFSLLRVRMHGIDTTLPPSPLRLFTRTSRFVYSEKRGRAENIWEYSLGEIKNSPGLRLTTLPPLLWFFPLFTVLQWLANSAIASLNLPPGLIVPVSVRFHDAFACSLVIQRDWFFFSLSLSPRYSRKEKTAQEPREKKIERRNHLLLLFSLSLSISRSLMSFRRKGGRKARPACSACK